MSSWTTLPNYSVGQPLSISKMDQTLDNFIVAGCHGHTGVAGDGGVVSGSMLRGSSGVQEVYQYITVLPFLPASKISGNVNAIISNNINGGVHRPSNGAGVETIGASSKYNVELGIGTWTLSFYYETTTANGILSACVGGASIGQVDQYNNPGAYNNLSNASTFSVSASGTYVLKLECVGKNVSSGGYTTGINHIELRRISA